MIKESSAEMGIDLYKMFVEIAAEKSYEDVMDEGKANNMKSRLEPSNSLKPRQTMASRQEETQKRLP